MVDDKDIDRILAMLPREADFYWTQASSHRAIPAAQVAGKAAAIGLRGRSYATVGEAWQQALADASPEDFIFVGGSSYVVADFLALLKAG
jgi:dihydrofolate synthase/folylpolyglutamate synthase